MLINQHSFFNIPTPNRKAPTANKAKAILRPIITGNRGANNNPANPRIANIPAIANKPTPKDSISNLDRIVNATDIAINAAAAINIANEPANVPCITCIAMANIPSVIDITSIACHVLSTSIFPIFFKSISQNY